MNLSANIRTNLNNALKEAEMKNVYTDFTDFISNKYGTKSQQDLENQLKHVSNEDVNEYFSDKFLDAEHEEDIDNLNAQEELIRKTYNVPDSDYEDESIFEPTKEDLEEMKYWYNDNPSDLYESQKLNEHNDSWLTNTDPTNHRVKPFVDFFKEQYPDKQIDKLWLEGIEGGWEPCVAFIESNGKVYRIYLDELNNGIYMSHPSGIKIVSNNFKDDYDYIDD